MLNQYYMTGKLTEKPVLKELENDKCVTNVTLEIPSNRTDKEGKPIMDYVSCSLWNDVAKKFVDQMDKGDAVAIKGYVKSKKELVNDINVSVVDVIGDKFNPVKDSNTQFDSSIVLVGRLTDNPRTAKTKDNVSVANLVIAIPRTYKNADGEYETDFVACTGWNGIAEKVGTYLQKGDLIGITGRLRNVTNDVKGTNVRSIDVVASKVSFLATSRVKDEIEKEDELEVE